LNESEIDQKSANRHAPTDGLVRVNLLIVGGKLVVVTKDELVIQPGDVAVDASAGFLLGFPNLFLVTNPVKVVRESGTIISAEVSLGYDVPRSQVEKMLLDAANVAELGDSFVHVVELGDSSVVYRVSGLLSEVKGLIRAQSRLREEMLDALHTGGVEIVSPGFVNRRAVDDRVFVPPIDHGAGETEQIAAESAEAVVFDKAEEAEAMEDLKVRYEELGMQLEALKQQSKQAADRTEKEKIKKRIAELELARDRLGRATKEET
jgi:hypothetical protein